MNNREKKPPIKISKLNEHGEGEHEKGKLSYIGSNGEKDKGKFTFQGLPQILLSCIISISIAAFLIFQLAPGKGDLQTLEGENAGLKKVVTELEGRLGKATGKLDNVINTMGEYSKKTEMDKYATKASVDALSGLPTQLDSRFDTLSVSLNEKIASLEETLEELGLTDEEGGVVTSGETVRWRNWKVYFSPALPEGFTYRIESDRIEEPGLYDIEIEIHNVSNANPEPFTPVLRMVIEPRDDTMVDVDTTSLWFADDPWSEWDADFKIVERGGKEWCRRIVFSSYHVYDFGVLAVGEGVRLELEFELYYYK